MNKSMYKFVDNYSKENELLRNFEFPLEVKGGVILKGSRDHVVPMLMEPWIEYYNSPVTYNEFIIKAQNTFENELLHANHVKSTIIN
ncbi:hypothetical protein SiH_0985 [Sulfolobus islandicus HVE10/4]|uniref:Uncharacterized protein n=1 Tax=Saccharolobus islandicus (strain HVE10/4) TaxID=930943 RepID=F0NK20_SACI0|nr:hypothetical protein SiH_0985 [Sulfolobus islandicus HVE10/4]